MLIELFWTIGHVGFGCLAFFLMYKLCTTFLLRVIGILNKVDKTLDEEQAMLRAIVGYFGLSRKDN